jgi:hypothetical protein
MLKHCIIVFSFVFIGNAHSQETQQFQFNIHRYNDSVRIESCIPLNFYNERLITPEKKIENKNQIIGIPMQVVGSNWIGNCLFIIGYILEFTNLREDQIIIIE